MTPKFRVWVKKDEEMRLVEKLCFESDGVLFELTTYPNKCCLSQHFIDEVILMQSTGLKDINGKEIYEGDVVLCEWGEIGDNIYRNTGKTVVDFSPHNLVMLEEADRLQILGNIYENPELLEEAKQ